RLRGRQYCAGGRIPRQPGGDAGPKLAGLPHVSAQSPPSRRGGEPGGGLYDINPTKCGEGQLFATYASNFPGEMSKTFNGVDAGFNARLPGGLRGTGGRGTGGARSNTVFRRADTPRVA